MGSSECHTGQEHVSAPLPERAGVSLPEFAYTPVPAGLETFRAFAHQIHHRIQRAHIAWTAIVRAPDLWKPYGQPDPYPDVPVTFLDEHHASVDLRSVLDRLVASGGNPNIWYESTPRRLTARPGTMEFLWQISTRLVRQATSEPSQP